MSKNINYRSGDIARFYAEHRRRWDELYPSEQWMFERVVSDSGRLGRVLDVGCAAGGLGDALAERFNSLQSYTGIDINEDAVVSGRTLARNASYPADFIAADICNWRAEDRTFDLVSALGVVDWNIEWSGNLAACWAHVAPGGHLVLSIRLTPNETICDMNRSFQFIWFDPPPIPPDTERAPYNIFNANEAVALLAQQQPAPETIVVFGYWGPVSAAARTPHERLIFSVAALRKPIRANAPIRPTIETHLPDDALKLPKQA
jgi:SAM-dependent methyltransferase